MSEQHSGNVVPEITNEEHQGIAHAKRVVLVGWNGSAYEEVGAGAGGITIGGASVTSTFTAIVLAPGSVTLAVPENAARNAYIVSTDPDMDGNVWVGHNSGMLSGEGIPIYDGGSYSDAPPSLYIGPIYAITDVGGTIYVEHRLIA